MENTLENKGKFFAQYWLQDVMTSEMYGDKGTIYSLTMKEKDLKDKWLELTPISDITDEDAIDIATIYYNEISKNCTPNADLGKWHVTEFLMALIPTQLDYLRSKGYALPYNGLSVKKQIEYGWVKLRTKD